MRYLYTLLVLSVAVQCIFGACYSGWESSEDSSYYICTAPYGISYLLQRSYPSQDICLQYNPDGCQKQGIQYWANCKQGYFYAPNGRCTMKCPTGYITATVYCKLKKI